MGPLSKVALWISGIYLVPLAFPWSLFLGRIMDRFGIDSMAFNLAFLLLGILLNAGILYFVAARIFPARAA